MGAFWFLGVKKVAKVEEGVRGDSITDWRVHSRVVGHGEASISRRVTFFKTVVIMRFMVLLQCRFIDVTVTEAT